MKYKAAIFDLDGTLIDSTWVWDFMIKKIFDHFKINENLNSTKQGLHMPPSEFAQFLKNNYKLNENILEIKDFILKTAIDFYKNKIELKKGAKRLLELMKKNSIKMSIATSCYIELTEIILKKWDIYDMFSCFLYSETLKTNKLSAKIYIAAAEKMCVKPCFCAVFEDIFLPILKVKEVNMGFFGVEDENRKDDVDEELKKKADYYIKDYDEFIDSGKFENFFQLS